MPCVIPHVEISFTFNNSMQFAKHIYRYLLIIFQQSLIIKNLLVYQKVKAVALATENSKP